MPCMHQHKWRALAVLGALLMVIFLCGPLTCASMPTPIINNISMLEFIEPFDTGTVNRKSETLVQVLNATNKRSERQLSNTGHHNNMAKVTTVDIKRFWLSTTVSPDSLDNPDVTKNNKSIINNSVSSSSNNNNNSNSDLVFNSNEYILRNQTTTELSILSLKLTTENYEKLGVTKKLRLTRTDRSLHTKNNNFNNNKNNNNNNNKNSNNNSNSSNIIQRRKRRKDSGLDRNERSANLSHITGTTRKIQLYIKNRYLQILPDGTVNGTQDELNDYTILQRTTVEIGRIKIQSVATCLFLCMDTCGTVYGSKESTDDCIFNEAIEQHHYNTYSSSYHSNPRRKLYLALNRHGQPRKIQIPASRPLGKLATYTKSLTQTVPHERVEILITRLFGPTYIRHGLKQLCDSGKSITELTAKTMKTKPKCNLKKQQQVMTKKKRNKRRCRRDEPESDLCIKPPITNHQQQASSSSPSPSSGNTGSNRNSDPDHSNINKPNQFQQARNRKNQKIAGQGNSKHEKCTEDDCKRNKNQKKNNKLAANQQISVSNSSINSSSNSSTTNLKKNRQNKPQLKKGGNHQQKILNPRKSTTTMQPSTKFAQQRRGGSRSGGVLKVIPTTEATTIATILSSTTTSQALDDDEMMYNDDSIIASASTESFMDDDEGGLEPWDDSNLIGDDDGVDGDEDSDEFDARK